MSANSQNGTRRAMAVAYGSLFVDCCVCGELTTRPKDNRGRLIRNASTTMCTDCEWQTNADRMNGECLGCESGTDTGYHTCERVTKLVVVS